MITISRARPIMIAFAFALAVISIAPAGRSESHLARGQKLADAGDFAGAIAEFTKSIESDPSSEVYVKRGNAKADRGDTEGALADYNKAIELKPDSALAFYDRGCLNEQRGKLESALADYTSAIKLDSKYSDALDNRAIVKQKMGDRAGALADQNAAIALSPKDGLLYLNRAINRWWLEDWDGALADYTKGIEFSPRDPDGYEGRAVLRRRKGDIQGAFDDENTAYELRHRIWMDAKVNGQPVELCFDTGTSYLLLFEKTVRRLGLKTVDPIPDPSPDLWGVIAITTTEKYPVTLFDATQTGHIAVCRLPGLFARLFAPRADGLLGWQAVRNRVIRVDAEHRVVSLVRELPSDINQWIPLRIRQSGTRENEKAGTILVLEATGAGRKSVIFGIDTGSPEGISVSNERWSELKQMNPLAPIAFCVNGNVSDGVYETEVMLAKKYILGSLLFKDVPVEPTRDRELPHWHKDAEAVLGMAALQQFDLILDGRHKAAYARRKDNVPLSFEYNRLGVRFQRQGKEPNPKLIAEVLPRTPAYESGLRNGDNLLEVSGEKASKLPDLNFEFAQHANWEFVVERNNQKLKIEVTARDILTTDAPGNR